MGNSSKRIYRPRFIWTDESIKLLGTMSDQNLAEELNIGRRTVTAKRLELEVPAYVFQYHHVWTEDQIQKLGTISDTQLSAEEGIHITAVGHKRQSLGIPVFTASIQELPEDFKLQLGIRPDAEIAELSGFSIADVARIRKASGLRSSSQRGRPPKRLNQARGKVSLVSELD